MNLVPSFVKSKSKRIPGSAIYTGNSELPTTIKHYSYRDHSLKEIRDLYHFNDDVTDWVSIEGFQDIERIKEYLEKSGIDVFTIEDILNVSQRNKWIKTDEYSFFVLKYASLKKDEVLMNYINIILKDDVIITLTDYKNPFSEEILNRVANTEARLSKQNEDYLAYVIYDLIIDEQIDLLKELSLQLESFEIMILDPSKISSNELYSTHKNLVHLRNNIKSFQESILPTSLLSSNQVSNALLPYLEDLEDHIKNVLEKANTSIEVCNSLIMMYSNQLSNKTNDIMKTLTIISALFIPLSFFAGVFGMNFTHFNILGYQYGILLFFLFSIVLVVVMIIYFKKRKWL